jgi:hypothetical protein
MLQNTMCEFISSLPKLGKKGMQKGPKKKLLISWDKMDGSISHIVQTFLECLHF